MLVGTKIMCWTFFELCENQIFKNNPQSIPKLNDEINCVISEIEPQLRQNFSEN